MSVLAPLLMTVALVVGLVAAGRWEAWERRRAARREFRRAVARMTADFGAITVKLGTELAPAMQEVGTAYARLAQTVGPEMTRVVLAFTEALDAGPADGDRQD